MFQLGHAELHAFFPHDQIPWRLTLLCVCAASRVEGDFGSVHMHARARARVCACVRVCVRVVTKARTAPH